MNWTMRRGTPFRRRIYLAELRRDRAARSLADVETYSGHRLDERVEHGALHGREAALRVPGRWRRPGPS